MALKFNMLNIDYIKDIVEQVRKKKVLYTEVLIGANYFGPAIPFSGGNLEAYNIGAPRSAERYRRKRKLVVNS